MKTCHQKTGWMITVILLWVTGTSFAQQLGGKLWEFNTGGKIEAAPSIGPDGTIYVTSGDSFFTAAGRLHALNPDGSKKWVFDAPSVFRSAPVVGPDNTVYLRNRDGSLYAIGADGAKKWVFAGVGGNGQGPCFAPDGTIYIASGDAKLFSINPGGIQKWMVTVRLPIPGSGSGVASPAVDHEGTIYFTTTDIFFGQNKIVAVTPNGSVKWDFFLGYWTTPSAIDEEGTIYIGQSLNNISTLYALNRDGTKKWYTTFTGDTYQNAPVIGPDGTIFIGSYSNKLHAITPDGKMKWEFPVGAAIKSAPAVDRNGAAYVACDDEKVYCVNADGTQKWVVTAGRTSPVITDDGTVLVASFNGFLSALRGGSPLAESPWPMAGHDAQHSGLAGGTTALRITSQPDSATVRAGDSATFRVSALSESPLQYQWRFNGSDIPGATSSNYVIRIARTNETGLYQVRVSNARGSSISATATLTVEAQVPFVTRDLPSNYYAGTKIQVRLSASPPATASTYAMEDQPPAGWVVSTISDGGLYDAGNNKVKFGPFFDNAARQVSYELMPPSASAQTLGVFEGAGSAGGASSPIIGDSAIDLADPLHPADNAPGDHRISIDEVTAYASAWRKGEPWPITPNPISIDFVTRAGALWKNGETYRYDPAVSEPVLRWLNTRAQPFLGLQSISGMKSRSSSAIASSVLRELSEFYIPSETLTVKLAAAPTADVTVYAVEDRPPNDWIVTNITHNGAFDRVNRQVKWGPFFDNTTRVFAYDITVPQTGTGLATFEGAGSFDGARVPITGVVQLNARSRLRANQTNSKEALELQLVGEIGTVYTLEYSSDLMNWTSMGTVANQSESVILSLPLLPTLGQRFYRALK